MNNLLQISKAKYNIRKQTSFYDATDNASSGLRENVILTNSWYQTMLYIGINMLVSITFSLRPEGTLHVALQRHVCFQISYTSIRLMMFYKRYSEERLRRSWHPPAEPVAKHLTAVEVVLWFVELWLSIICYTFVDCKLWVVRRGKKFYFLENVWRNTI